jgi:hypothetical protein
MKTQVVKKKARIGDRKPYEKIAGEKRIKRKRDR